MPEYIQNVSRIPKPGKNFDVTEASVEIIKSLNRGGNVSFTISSPPTIKSRVISALPFESLAEIEAFHDGFASSDEMRDRFQKLAADCEDANVAIIRHVRQPSSLPAEPKYIVRTLMLQKGEKRPHCWRRSSKLVRHPRPWTRSSPFLPLAMLTWSEW